jgi:crotonobetainyl-CoA:carnitine CoA-transferase CaiB-like acyl-CoA transferase
VEKQTMLLSDIRIIDLSERLPGPYASMLLGDLGAEVLKVERPGRGEFTRVLGSEFFNGLNRNKKSLCLNLKSPEGQKIFRDLSKTADVILEGFRPGVTGRLGIDFETIKKINPKIVYCSISGYGQKGPYKNQPGHDINYLGIAGALHINGKPEPPPTLPVSDLSASLFAVISILAALMGREKAGEGQYIDLSMTDAVISLVGAFCGEYFTDHKKMEINFIQGGHYGIFKTKDNKYLTLGVEEDHFWERLCRVIGDEEMAGDPRYQTLFQRIKNRRKIRKYLKEIFLTRSREEWLILLNEADIPCGPLNRFKDVFSDPQVLHRSILKEVVNGRGKKMKQISFPARFSGAETTLRMVPPLLGQHTEEILTGMGYSQQKILDLKERKVIESSR